MNEKNEFNDHLHKILEFQFIGAQYAANMT